MTTTKDTEQEAPELIALHPQTLRLKNGYIYLIEDAEHGDVIYRRVDPPAAPPTECAAARPDDGSECAFGWCPRPRDGCSEYCAEHHASLCVKAVLHCSCGASCTPQEYARHRERGHDAAEQLIAEGEPMTQQSDTERLSYEILLTDKWDEHNRRRLELITRKQSAPLTESESEELHRLQWLAGIKRELTHGPLPLPLIDSQAELAHAARTPMGVSIAESAATAMRDTCVEKVRECLAERARTPPESEDYEYDQAVCFVLYGVIDKLALLTLDNCES